MITTSAVFFVYLYCLATFRYRCSSVKNKRYDENRQQCDKNRNTHNQICSLRHNTIPENNPCKPIKAIAIRAAVISAIGNPLNALGVFADSNLTRMQLKTTMINKKPTDVPTALAKEPKNDSPWSVFP